MPVAHATTLKFFQANLHNILDLVGNLVDSSGSSGLSATLLSLLTTFLGHDRDYS